MNVRRGFLLGLIAILLLLSYWLVEPFIQYFLISGLLAFVLFPLQQRFEPRVGAGITAFLLILGTFVALIVPFVVIIALVAEDAAMLAEQAGETDVQLGQIEGLIAQYTGQEIDIAQQASSYAEDAAQIALGSATGVLGAATDVLVGVAIGIFVLFFLLKDGDALLAWLYTMIPLPEDVRTELTERLEAITWAVLLGHVLVAFVQGAIAGIGLFVTGIPNATFWTFMMIILALLPIIGAFIIWGPAAVYLVATGEPLFGAALFVYGAIVVSVTDEFLRPVIVDRYASINPSVILVGVVGGLYLVGFMGLFIGPVIVGALKAVVEIFNEHYTEL
jgi:predicted PurR-regulated permease PerM